MLELHHWEPTFNSGEPILLLKEKGSEFTSRYADLLAGVQHSAPFLKLNRAGQVPVLVHDGRAVTETTLLLQYIEAALPGPSLLPATAQGRYQMQVWSKYADEYFAPAIALLGWRASYAAIKPKLGVSEAGLSRLPPERRAVWRKALDNSYTEDETAAAKSRLAVRVAYLENCLSRASFLAGESYTLADIIMFFLARALPVVVPELASASATPRLMDWLARVEARPAVQSTLAMARSPHPERTFAPGPEVPRWG